MKVRVILTQEVIEVDNCEFKHKIICADCRDEETYKKLIKDKKIKCVFTSPPYNMGSNLYANTVGMDYKDNL